MSNIHTSEGGGTQLDDLKKKASRRHHGFSDRIKTMNDLEQPSKSSWLSYIVLALPYVLAIAMTVLLIYCQRNGDLIYANGEPLKVTDEDGWAEWGSCIAFGLLGLVALAAIFMKRTGEGKARKILLLVMAIGAFAAVGEELSWGQRIFGFAPPEVLKSEDGKAVTMGHNDVTAHNISFELGPYFGVGPLKFSIGGMLFGFPMFVLLAFHTIYLPWKVGRGGEKTKRFVKKLGLFLPPIHLGVLLVIFTIFFRVTRKSWAYEDGLGVLHKIDSGELMELLVPAVYVMFLLNCFFRDRRRSSQIVTALTLLIFTAGLVGSLYLAIHSYAS